MALEKITEEQMDTYGVCAAPDILSGTAAENKNLFDRMTRQLVVPKLNACIDAINEGTGGGEGSSGKDGFSPVVEMNKTDGVTTLKITDKEGEHTSTIEDGTDGFSPVVELEKNGKVTTLTITDKEGTKSVNINDGADGGGEAAEEQLISEIDFSRWNDEAFDVTYADGTVKGGSVDLVNGIPTSITFNKHTLTLIFPEVE